MKPGNKKTTQRPETGNGPSGKKGPNKDQDKYYNEESSDQKKKSFPQDIDLEDEDSEKDEDNTNPEFNGEDEQREEFEK